MSTLVGEEEDGWGLIMRPPDEASWPKDMSVTPDRELERKDYT